LSDFIGLPEVIHIFISPQGSTQYKHNTRQITFKNFKITTNALKKESKTHPQLKKNGPICFYSASA